MQASSTWPRSLYELRSMRCGDDEGSDEDDGEGVGLRALVEAEVQVP